MIWQSAFKGKKMTIMGLGLLGRGVGDAQFLAQQGAELIVTDLKNDADLRTSLDALKDLPNITYRLGGHDLRDFKDRDYILKAAGVPLNSPYIAQTRKNNIPIKMSASWFAELSGIPLVGVTGTRGKSTTTMLLYEIMKAAGMDVLLGGNVRGVSTLALLPEVKKDSIALMELDSWQLQGFGEAGMSPNVAVFTTFLKDHMNYYKNDMGTYFADKAQIFLHQKQDDTLVVSSQVVVPHLQKYKSKIASHVVIAEPKHFPKGWTLQIPGEHNKLNAMCAIEAARALGIDDVIIKAAVEAFKGVPGRLELVREVKGVKVYNDTTATTPEATDAALSTLDPGAKKNIVLIFGGADKGLDMSELIAEIPKHCKKVILLAGTGTEKIQQHFPDAPVFDALTYALQDAMDEAQPGDTILFSPAFASFGMFKNEFDRGDQFDALVKAL